MAFWQFLPTLRGAQLMNEAVRNSVLIGIDTLSNQVTSLCKAPPSGPDFDPPPCGKDGQDRPFVSNNLNDAGVDQPTGHVVQRTRSLWESLPNPRIIRRMIQQRQMRSQFFASGLFADPAWDMLLDLAVAAKEYRQVSVTSLSIASCTPPTTALRWIDVLIEEGLVDRVEDPIDRTLVFVALTDEGLMALAGYFKKLRS